MDTQGQGGLRGWTPRSGWFKCQQGKGAPAPQCPPSQTVCLMLGPVVGGLPSGLAHHFLGPLCFLRQVQVGSHLKSSDPSLVMGFPGPGELMSSKGSGQPRSWQCRTRVPISSGNDANPQLFRDPGALPSLPGTSLPKTHAALTHSA